MANGMDEAASAFDTAIRGESGGAAQKSSGRGGRGGGDDNEETLSVEQMFGHLGELEVDEKSPPVGGGDEEPNPGEIDIDDEPVKKPKPADDDEDEEDEDDEEADADDDEDDDSDDDEDEDEDEPEGLMAKEFDITIDGEPAKVTLKEALEGYTRTKTFHQRLTALNQDAAEVQKAASAVVQNFDFSLQTIEAIDSLIQKIIPPEPDWDAEFAKSPEQARMKQKFYEGVRGHLSEFENKRKEVFEAKQKHELEETRRFATEGRTKFERAHAKEWAANPKQRVKDQSSMYRTAAATGFTDQEIETVYDPRMLEILYKASKYDRMMAARPKPVNNGSKKPATSGSGNKSRTDRRGVDRAMSALTKSGSIHDAAPVFDRILNRR